MGLFTGLVTLPLAPVRGVVWLAEVLQEQAEAQLYDPGRIAAEMQAVADAVAAGEMTEDEAAEAEERLIARLRGDP
ncbi:gas vesicle protein GvpG [Actinomadura oligospora]|uniref:gas vesicle protein GvpG n=1 Tax=Actinomadura oligospora TaxID=111804 RepID=UPI0004795319|nr:gas vesicle protein GvpG [Actinomadura oligospora]